MRAISWWENSDNLIIIPSASPSNLQTWNLKSIARFVLYSTFNFIVIRSVIRSSTVVVTNNSWEFTQISVKNIKFQFEFTTLCIMQIKRFADHYHLLTVYHPAVENVNFRRQWETWEQSILRRTLLHWNREQKLIKCWG